MVTTQVDPEPNHPSTLLHNAKAPRSDPEG